jgi:hypothetical protein
MEQLVAAVTPMASFAWIMKVPLVVGVPVMAPVEAVSVSPVGSVPGATEKVKGATPPLVVGAGLLKATLTSPVVTAEQVIMSPATMLKEPDVAVARLASFTWTVKPPGAPGVPVTAPVEVLSDTPLGSAPLATEKVKGPTPPMTVGGLFKAAPTSPWLAG